MRHRTTKRVVIAVIFLGFWTGAGGLVSLARREPPPAPTPTPRPVRPLAVESATVLRISEDRADIVGVITNPNGDAGARDVSYSFTVAAGGETRTIPGTTFILPGRQKVVVSFAQEVPPGAVTAELHVAQPAWTFVDEGFEPPSLVLVNRTTRVIPGDPTVFEVKGLLANQSPLDYRRVEITAVGRDAEGDIVGASHTFAGSLLALERREFTAQWPLPPGAEVAAVQVFPSVNVFEPDAVQRREGPLDVPDAPVLPTRQPGA